LDSFSSESEIQLNRALAANIKEHCEKLIADFKQYFPENLTPEFCIRDTFSTEDILPESFTANEKYELIELSCNGSLKNVQEGGFDRVLVGEKKAISAHFR
jgi:hypothetical protein